MSALGHSRFCCINHIAAVRPDMATDWFQLAGPNLGYLDSCPQDTSQDPWRRTSRVVWGSVGFPPGGSSRERDCRVGGLQAPPLPLVCVGRVGKHDRLSQRQFALRLILVRCYAVCWMAVLMWVTSSCHACAMACGHPLPSDGRETG